MLEALNEKRSRRHIVNLMSDLILQDYAQLVAREVFLTDRNVNNIPDNGTLIRILRRKGSTLNKAVQVRVRNGTHPKVALQNILEREITRNALMDENMSSFGIESHSKNGESVWVIVLAGGAKEHGKTSNLKSMKRGTRASHQLKHADRSL